MSDGQEAASAPDEAPWYVYILRCADGTLYTGIAKETARRLSEHNAGQGARYTRSRLPVQLVYEETVPDRGSALRREHEIKRMSAAGKHDLIKGSPA